jgi:hypothetical protein
MRFLHPATRVVSGAALCASLCVGLPCSADVFVVDDSGGPGVDFTDIQPAVAVAVPGDILLVQPGSYSAFTLYEGLTIVGQGPGVRVAGQIKVLSVDSGQVAVLASMKLQQNHVALAIEHVHGTLVLDGLEIDTLSTYSLHGVLLGIGAKDVRAHKLDIFYSAESTSWGFNSGAAITLNDYSYRLELVQSSLQGRIGADTSSGEPAGWGGRGLVVAGTSFAHVVSCEIAGGHGGASTAPCASAGPAGDGGDAVAVLGNARVVAAGDGVTAFWRGGRGGASNCTPGLAGPALFVGTNAFARYSGIVLQGALEVFGTTEVPDPPDPYLELADIPQPGAAIRFDVHGEPGDLATLFLGRKPLLQAIPGVLIERLTNEERQLDLGAIPLGGSASFVLDLPLSLGPGFTFFAQARILRNGQELRTNSVPVVLR